MDLKRLPLLLSSGQLFFTQLKFWKSAKFWGKKSFLNDLAYYFCNLATAHSLLISNSILDFYVLFWCLWSGTIFTKILLLKQARARSN